MMVAFVLDQIFFVHEVCLPCAAYTFDFNHKLMFDGIHIRSHLLVWFLFHIKTSLILNCERSNVPQSLLTISKYTHQGVAYAKIHKALHTW